jgi:hypothetical protein
VSISAVALGSLVAVFGAIPANAAEAPTASNDQVTLTDARADALLLEADIPAVPASGLRADPTDVEGWEIPGVVSFVSVGLDSPQTEVRSFVGAYFSTTGVQISTVEVVYNTDNTMTSWTNGEKIDPADLCAESAVGVSDSTTAGVTTAAATTTRDFCWYLNKYAEGEIALGTLVAAAGGVTALFTGPVGAAIAAAGGLKAALGGMYKWLISLWCL